MTKSETLCRLREIINWVDTLDINDNEAFDIETTKDLIDLLVNFTSFCQSSLMKEGG
ncbi:MAG: hypothetical protein MJA84_08235 [Firmicutes bacterium]|nr:hypothetical protein [Bacillota bacterium]